ncbi:MAG TPA: hypothetical protein VFP99_03920 [Chthoniobacterales bacterium]|nr:hypothetical protein [Chthoniobacterales bacterium]
MTRLDFLKRAEWGLAVLLTATTLFLLVTRATHAGALWRDECAVVNLARMPSAAEIAQNFQYESFPVPFPILIRGYTDLFGTSDFALRCFGFIAAIAVLCALWFNAKVTGPGPPLVSIALLGLNPTFLFWGTTVRGYGLGSALIVLAFGLLATLLREISPGRVFAAALASVAAIQCLVNNLALVAALVACAAIVCLVRHDFRRLIIFLSILAVCMLSFLPYLNAYSNAWSQVVEFPVALRLLWNEFNFALGNPHRAVAWFWHAAFVVLLAASARQLYRLRANELAPEKNVLLFGSLAVIAAPSIYYEFLQTLGHLTPSWYFLALISLLAVALDLLAATLSSSMPIRIGRVVFAVVALGILPINAWPKIFERQTNIDIVAQKITEQAKPTDLIVLAPWQYALSFNRYYHGATPSITLPAIVDLRVHRYDLLREKMLSDHPIDDVLEKIDRTLAAGNRVWIVGGIRLLPEGRGPRTLPPAPNANVGWDNVAYSDAWFEQLGAFVREHSQRGQNIPLPSHGRANPFEDVPLIVVDGWQ